MAHGAPFTQIHSKCNCDHEFYRHALNPRLPPEEGPAALRPQDLVRFMIIELEPEQRIISTRLV